MVLEAAPADTREACADLHLNGKRIDRLSARAGIIHKSGPHRHTEAGL